jgi:hypothetical protein
MNLYASLASGMDNAEATSLSTRLAAWHDAMVAHERRLRTRTTGELCGDECPHVEARGLWTEALNTFGARANELAFLRSRGSAAAPVPAPAIAHDASSKPARRPRRTDRSAPAIPVSADDRSRTTALEI